MARWNNIFKNINIRTFVFMSFFAVSLLFAYSLRAQEANQTSSTENQETKPSGTPCGKEFRNGCPTGQVCIKTQEMNQMYGVVTTTYKCVARKDVGMNPIVVGGEDIAIGGYVDAPRAPRNICSDQCLPSCYYKALEKCTFCDLFKVAYNTSSRIAYHSIVTFSGSVMQVVIIGFAIWLAITVLAFVSTPETRDVKDLIQSILQQGFIVALVVILLESGAMSFFNLALEPIYNTGTSIAQKTLEPDAAVKMIKKSYAPSSSTKDELSAKEKEDLKYILKPEDSVTDTSGDKSAFVKSLEKQKQEREDGFNELLEKNTGIKISNRVDLNPPVKCKSDYGIINMKTDVKGALPQSMGNSVICTMTLVQNRVSKIKAIGSAAVCQSWKDRFLIIPNLGYLLTGLGFWIGAMILIVAVPFLMLDAVIEIAVAAALLPVAIGAYAFKITRKYVKPVWDTFMNSMFTFLFLSLIILMLTVAFESIINTSLGQSLDDIVTSKSGTVISDILVNMSWSGKAFLKVCFVLILTWTVMGEVKDFAGQFASSISNTGIGSQIGTMGASAAKGAAIKVGKTTAKKAGEAAWSATKATGRGVVHGFRRSLMRNQANKAIKQGVRSEDGTYTYSKRNRLTGTRTEYSVTLGADGSPTVTKSTIKKKLGVKANGLNPLKWRVGLQEQKIVKEKNEHFSIRHKEVRNDKTGEFERKGGERIRHNSSEIRQIFNRDNTFNDKIFDNVMQSGDEKMQAAAIKMMMKQRMPSLDQNLKDNDFVTRKMTRDKNGQINGYIEIHKDGSKTEVKFTRGANNRLKTEYTHIDNKGNGKTLTSDGVVNRKQTFRTSDGTVNGAVDKDSVRSVYGLTDYYNKYQKQRRYRKVAWDESMFTEEEIHEAKIFMNSYHADYRQSSMYEFNKISAQL